jgi:acyl-CoA hydrolase
MMRSLLELLTPGRSIYLPGASGEVIALAQALAAEPERMSGVEVTSALVPGINRFDYAALDASARLITFLLPPALRSSFEAGRVCVLPIAYSAIARYLGSRPRFDVAVAHVAPPNDEGRCSLGIASDFSPIAWKNATFRVAVINSSMPRILRGPTITASDADLIIEVDSPLLEAPAATENQILSTIAAQAANFVTDGATIQVGIGGAPAKIWSALTSHRGLIIASGMISDEVRMLDESGTLADCGHQTGVALGSLQFYRWLAETDRVEFATTVETHDVLALAKRKHFTAINSAIEVDLFGQANLEWQSGRLSSGVGGAPDFTRGAALSQGGRSLILLPSTAKGGAVSRIVARIDAPTVSVPRSEIDVVVTEFGTAELRNKSQDERAAALIGIAAPEWREKLALDWHGLRKTL